MWQRSVLVTGAGGGLGRAISVAFARAGYDVGVNYAHSLDDARVTASELRSLGVRAELLQADVADDADVRRMARNPSAPSVAWTSW